MAGDITPSQTIAVMARYARAGAAHPLVRKTAAAIVQNADPHDSVAQVDAIARWVGDHLQFLRDPEGQERVEAPWTMLADIASAWFTQGDCDDMATLVAALALAVGLSVMFVTVGLDTPDAPFSHVYATLRGPGMPGWLDVDPARTETDGHRITTLATWAV